MLCTLHRCEIHYVDFNLKVEVLRVLGEDSGNARIFGNAVHSVVAWWMHQHPLA